MKPLNRKLLSVLLPVFGVGVVVFPFFPTLGFFIALCSGAAAFPILFDSIPAVGGR